MDKTPKWFRDWLLNDYKHLVKDVLWIKVLVIGIFLAVIGAALTNLFLG